MIFTLADDTVCRNIQPAIEALAYNSTEVAADTLNRLIDWTPAAAAGLQESVLGGGLYTICLTDDSVSIYILQCCYTFT